MWANDALDRLLHAVSRQESALERYMALIQWQEDERKHLLGKPKLTDLFDLLAIQPVRFPGNNPPPMSVVMSEEVRIRVHLCRFAGRV